MSDIFLSFPVNAPIEQVFDAVASPTGLNQWWTLRSNGKPTTGSTYELYFTEGYDWRANVLNACAPFSFELKITKATPDWQGTRVIFSLEEKDGYTQVNFSHLGWPDNNDHFRTSSFCWAMYLRLMKRYVEFGETVKYGKRLNA